MEKDKTINFAKNTAEATICVISNENQIELRDIKSKNIPVGFDKLNMCDVFEKPVVNLVFNCVESVDIMIKALNDVKNNMIYGMNLLPLAC